MWYTLAAAGAFGFTVNLTGHDLSDWRAWALIGSASVWSMFARADGHSTGYRKGRI